MLNGVEKNIPSLAIKGIDEVDRTDETPLKINRKRGERNSFRMPFPNLMNPVVSLRKPASYLPPMEPIIHVKRTTTDDADFQQLVNLLDDELWNELKEDQATYDQFNKVPQIETALVLYAGEQAVACGCFKPFDSETAEIKRMYVKKAYRGRGFSRTILQNLEAWAKEKGYTGALLETSVHFHTAINLYRSSGYAIIPNYPPYEGLAESVCLKKNL